ncbi:MAG: HAMP domain-containing protein [Evtepia gabavorous]
MDLALPIQRGGQDYIIYILDQRATVRELNSQLFQLIIEALAFGLIISVLLSFLLSRAMVTPIRALTRGAQRVAEGDFDHKIQVESHDEIGVLTNAFNAMAGQLQATLQAVDSERTKLSTLFLHMTDGVVAFNQSGEVIHANPAAEEMLDMEIPLGGTVTYQDLLGRSPRWRPSSPWSGTAWRARPSGESARCCSSWRPLTGRSKWGCWWWSTMSPSR